MLSQFLIMLMQTEVKYEKLVKSLSIFQWIKRWKSHTPLVQISDISKLSHCRCLKSWLQYIIMCETCKVIICQHCKMRDIDNNIIDSDDNNFDNENEFINDLKKQIIVKLYWKCFVIFYLFNMYGFF